MIETSLPYCLPRVISLVRRTLACRPKRMAAVVHLLPTSYPRFALSRSPLHPQVDDGRSWVGMYLPTYLLLNSVPKALRPYSKVGGYQESLICHLLGRDR